MTRVVVVGAGIGGMAAAIAAADQGADVTLVEKAGHVGGAAAYSGGQVWVGANHVAARHHLHDDVESTLAYITARAAQEAGSLDPEMAREWIAAAREAARYFEESGVIQWELIPDYPDYYYPDTEGSRAAGRYLTGAAFDATSLGEHLAQLYISPHFPVGITYPEMFAWGGMSSRTEWDWNLVRARREAHILTFGSGIAAAFFKGVLDRGVRLLLEHPAIELIRDGDRAAGVVCRQPNGATAVLRGTVILATGALDWSAELVHRFTSIPPDDGGSVAPPAISGDALALVGNLGGMAASLPPWAAPVLPGYRLALRTGPDDTGYRACFEHCLPHTFLVNGAGERFADDSFHPAIVAAALRPDESGSPANLPFFMIWDDEHHQRYGLGATMPGEAYPEGLVSTADTIGGLAAALGLPPEGLERTTQRFNTLAETGVDQDFGRGSNLSVRRFRGDWNNEPNPCLGPVARPPFHGMRMRLLNTGIAAAGVRAGTKGRVLDSSGTFIEGLYAVGECSDRAAAGVGYNSGYSLSRAMTYGYLAALDAAGRSSSIPLVSEGGVAHLRQDQRAS